MAFQKVAPIPENTGIQILVYAHFKAVLILNLLLELTMTTYLSCLPKKHDIREMQNFSSGQIS